MCARPDLVLELFDPEFTEAGASDLRRDARSILTVTGGRPVSPDSPVVVTGMSGTVLAPGIVHLTYFGDDRGRRVWRGPLRSLTGTGRRMRCHQGTPAA
ncbi:DUF4440 domain-containing protein [Streptomyces sp. NPDC090075]|uniref:DUF4440 domain-containing protein n=1 Tax=Streptomyces sp. NPDC090075 TaxID=3365937 RepID=UPI0038022B5E